MVGPATGGALVAPLSGLAAAPWPGFLHDALHSSTSAALGPQTANVRWSVRLEGPVVPGPAVGSGGVVYAASNGGVLHALDVRTGAERWRFDGQGGYGSDLSTVPALLPDGTILWPGPHDTLYALDAAGRLMWKHSLSDAVLSPLVGSDGTIYAADVSGRLDALRPRPDDAPTVRWTRRLGSGASYSSPALGQDGTVYLSVDRTLYAVGDEGASSRVLWSFDASDISEVSPAVTAEGTVVFGANDSVVYGLSPEGELRWRHRLSNITYSSPAADDTGHVVVGDSDGHIVTLDARTGAQTATTPRGGAVWTAPAVDRRGDVYWGTQSGRVYGARADGEIIWRLDAGGTVDSYPALAGDGTLLIGSEDGTLYAIGTDVAVGPTG